MRIWNRVVNVSVGDLQFPNTIKISLAVNLHPDDDHDKGTVTLYNVSKAHEDRIKSKQNIIIEAGYTNFAFPILKGSVEKVKTTRQGVDRICVIHLHDDYLDHGQGGNPVTVTTTVKQAPLYNVITNIIRAGTFRDKNEREAAALATQNNMDAFEGRNHVKVFSTEVQSYSATEKPIARAVKESVALRTALKGHNLSTYYDGSGWDFNWDYPSEEPKNVISLSERTGLIKTVDEHDEKGSDSDETYFQVTSLLNPRIKRGTGISLHSYYHEQELNVVSLTHRGDNWDGPFETVMMCKPRASPDDLEGQDRTVEGDI